MVPSVALEKIPSDTTGDFFFVLCSSSMSYCRGCGFCPLLYNTHNTNIHAPGGIRTRNRNRRSAADPCLRQLGHWDRHGIDPETFRLAAQCLNHYDTPGPSFHPQESIFTYRHDIGCEWERGIIAKNGDYTVKSLSIWRHTLPKWRRMRWGRHVACMGEISRSWVWGLLRSFVAVIVPL